MTQHDRPLLCLSASGGGHVRQILDLEPLWRDYPHFFVTEDTALGRSIAKKYETEFVPHFALGQARLGAPFKMFGLAWLSMWRSLRIVFRRAPRVVITTGAGSQLFVVFWARLRGAKIILIDSFARFDRPSAFARIAGPLAHVRIAQSEESAKYWRDASVFNPLKKIETPAPPKEALLFATVGATLAFPRLSRLVVEAKQAGMIPERVILQVGRGSPPLPEVEGLQVVEELPFDEVQALLKKAAIVVCHGGTGSIITALREHCRVIVIPRQFELREHYDNHQEEITASFEQRGLLSSAHDGSSFEQALLQVRAKPAVAATTDPSALIEHLRELIDDMAPKAA